MNRKAAMKPTWKEVQEMEAMELKELADEHDLADPGREFEDIDDAREYVCERLGLEVGDDEDDDEEEEEKKHKQDEDDEDEDDEDENDEAIQRLRQKAAKIERGVAEENAQRPHDQPGAGATNRWRPHGIRTPVTAVKGRSTGGPNTWALRKQFEFPVDLHRDAAGE
jgi:hypothetical protein